MNLSILLIAVATFGIEEGWRRTDDGQIEYVVQLDPAAVEALRDGLSVRSDIPPQVQGVRRVRIFLGEGPLPRVAMPKPELSAPEPPRENASIDPPNTLRPPPDGARFVEPATHESSPEEPRAPERNTDPYDDGRYAGDDRGFTPTVPPDGVDPPGDLPVDQPRFDDPAQTVPASTSPNTGAPEPRNSWGWLSAALVALAASVGLNFYQGWVTFGLRRRYHSVVDRLPR
jgi:hypothetical protein